MNRRIVVSTLILGLVAAVAAAGPSVEYGPNGVRVIGVKPGTKIAWMALVRKNHEYHEETVVVRGIAVATGNGSVDVDHAPKVWSEGMHAIWGVADVDEIVSVRSSSPGFAHSQRPVVVHATEDGTTIRIESIAAEVMYVRGRSGVWSFAASDGAGLDGDGKRNGTIVVPLASLQPYRGNPNPPDRVMPGDLILVIDPYEIRATQYQVPQ